MLKSKPTIKLSIKLFTFVLIVFVYVINLKAEENSYSHDDFIIYSSVNILKRDDLMQKSLLKVKSLYLEDAPLRTAIYGILIDTGLNVVFDQDIDLSLKVTLRFENIELIQALEYIMRLADLSFELKDNTIYIKKKVRKIFKVEYPKFLYNYNAFLGGNILGGSGGVGAGGTGTGTGMGAGMVGSGGTGMGAGMVGSGGTGMGSVSGGFTMSYSKIKGSDDLFEQLKESISKMLSPEGSLILDLFNNRIIVEDRPSRVYHIQKYIQEVQKNIEKQVLIEARIIELQYNNSTQVGIDWNALFKDVFGSAVSISQNLSLSGSAGTLTVVSSDFNAIINFISKYGKLETISNPRILTLNNRTAILGHGDIYPFWEKEIQNTTAGTSLQTNVSYNRYNVMSGIIFSVTPTIKEDNSILLHIVPISTSITDIREFREKNETVAEGPVVNIKQFGTIVKVRDGEVIIIGGLINKSKRNKQIKLPLVGDLPFVGNLFKQTTVEEDKKELILFIKASLLSDFINIKEE